MYSDETDLLPPDQDRRLGDPPPALHDDHHPPRGQGGVKPSIESLERLDPYRLCPESTSRRTARRTSARPRCGTPYAPSTRAGEQARLRRHASRCAIATLVGRAPVPHGPPSRVSLQHRAPSFARRAAPGTTPRFFRRLEDERGTALDGENALITGEGPAGLGPPRAARRPRARSRSRPLGARHHRRRRGGGRVRGRPPAVVFNCAAFHNVEVCERKRIAPSRSTPGRSSASGSAAPTPEPPSCT